MQRDFESQENEIVLACTRHEHSRAAAMVVDAYGASVLAFLMDRARSHSVAHDVFSDFSEKVLLGMSHFEGRGTARSWAFRIASNALRDYYRAPEHQRKRQQTLSDPEVERIATRVRTGTAPYLRSDVKRRFRDLRRQLPEKDQTLLVLRVDQGMAWNEIAYVTLAGDKVSDEEAIPVEAARLRRQFARAKEKLRALAEQAGLLPQRPEL